MKLLLFMLLLSGLGLNTSAQDDKKYKDSIKVIVSFMVDESGQPDDINLLLLSSRMKSKSQTPRVFVVITHPNL